MRATTATVSSLLAMLALGACGETVVDGARSEDFVRGVVVGQIGARVASVACPDEVEVRKGATFDCLVTGTDGSKGSVRARQTDGKGSVQVVVPFLHVREAEAVMAREISKQAKARATVDCPEIVVDRKGALVRCTASAPAGGATRPVRVRLTDGAGNFRYRPPAGLG